jgi:hypothetical protein
MFVVSCQGVGWSEGGMLFSCCATTAGHVFHGPSRPSVGPHSSNVCVFSSISQAWGCCRSKLVSCSSRGASIAAWLRGHFVDDASAVGARSVLCLAANFVLLNLSWLLRVFDVVICVAVAHEIQYIVRCWCYFCLLVAPVCLHGCLACCC